MTLAVAPTRQNAPRPPRAAPAPRSAPKTKPRSRTKAAPKPFTLAHFRRWTPDLILDTGEPWITEDFQEWFAEDLFSGVSEAWLIVPEGNTKTTTLAGLSLYHCEFRPYAVVPVAAASREQAEIMYRQGEGFVLRSPRMHEPVHSPIQAAKGKRKLVVPRFLCLEGYRRINHHAGGRIQVFAADDRTGDGVIPTFGVIDEPHRQKDLSLYRTWAGKLAKREGQIAAISTRGDPGSDFEETLQRIRESATSVESKGAFTRYSTGRIVLHEWSLPETDDPQDIAAVKRTNPFSGITPEMLAEKFSSPTMTMHHWLRFVCNRPTEAEDAWLGPDGPQIWDGLEQPYDFKPRGRTWVGVDVALKHDTTAVVAMQERGDTPPGGPTRWHAVCRLFVPAADRPVDVTDVMKHIRELAAKYDVEAISYDPRFFDVPAKMLSDEGLPLFEVPQSIDRMTAACGSLFEAINRGQVTHDPDPPFSRQVLSASPRFSDRGFTLAKGKSRGKIDAAIALALAHDQALRHESEPPSTYEDRGMVAV